MIEYYYYLTHDNNRTTYAKYRSNGPNYLCSKNGHKTIALYPGSGQCLGTRLATRPLIQYHAVQLTCHATVNRHVDPLAWR